MIPKLNPRKMQQMMRRMGIQQQDIEDAQQVIIRCSDREIVIDNPSVAKVNMMGQETFQISGQESERSLDTKPEINNDDVNTVMEQAGVAESKARQAIEEAKGDLAQAIMSLKNEE